MAYGIKYKLSFCAPSGVPTRYEILKRGYAGTQYDVEGTGSPFIPSKSGKDIDSALVPTEAIIQIRENANFNTEEIITSDEKEYQVKYYENNALEWMGYLMPDFFDRELSGFPVIELTAVDHIGMLKDIPYQNANGKPFQDRQNLLTVLTNCIKKTDIPLNIKVVVDIVSSEWDAIDPIEPPRSLSFFRDTYIESSRFSDDRGNVVSVHDVLETTLNLANARIYIEGGHFWVTNRREIELGIGTVYTFDQSGNQIGSGAPLNPKTVNFDLLDVGGMQEVVPANSATQIYSEHGPSFPMPKNNTFQGYSAGTYPNWTNHNGYQIEDTFVNVDRYSSNGTIVQQGVTEIPRPWVRSKATIQHVLGYDYIALNNAPYTESEAIPVLSPLDVKSMAFSVGLKGFQEDIFIAVVTLKVYNSDSTLNRIYLLRESGDWGDWTNFQQQELTGYFLRMQIPTRETRTGLPNYNSVEKVFTLSAAPIPTVNIRSGTRVEVNVRLYGHTLGSVSTHMMTIQSLSLDIDYGSEPKGILFSSINDGNFTKKTDPSLTLFSDKVTSGKGSPFIGIARTITSNLITRTGKLTENWTGLGSSVSGFLNMVVANQLGSSSNAARKRLSISIDSGKLSLNDRYTISCISGVFMAYNLSYDPHRGNVKVDLIECLTANRNDRNTITTPDDSDKGTNIKGVGSLPSGGGSGSAPQDLQSVTDIGAETTNIIAARGIRAGTLLELPDNEPPLADRRAGKTYLYANGDGSGSSPAPTLGNLEDLQNVADVIPNNKYLFKGSDGIWRGVDINLPDLSGYATQSWVTIQLGSYVPTTRTINGKALSANITLSASDVGAMTQTDGDGRYVTLATKQTVTGAKYFSGAIGLPNTEPTVAQRESGVTYLYANGDGSGSTPPPLIANLEDLQNVQSSIANGKYLQKINGVWTGVDISFPSLAGYALESWVNVNFAKADGVNASGTWGINISGSANYALNSTRLYASTPPYNYGGSVPYYMKMDYNPSVNRWRLSVTPETPTEIEVAYADNADKWNGLGRSSTVIGTGYAPSGLYAEIGSGTSYPINAQGVREFLGMPSGGDTLNSVMSRGYSTDYDLFFSTKSRAIIFGDIGTQIYAGGDGRINLYTGSQDRLTIFPNGQARFKDSVVIGDGGFYLDSYTSLVIGGTKDGLIKFRGSYAGGDGAEIHQGPDGNIYIGTSSIFNAMTLTPDGKLTAPTIRATSALGIPNGAPPVAMREAGVTYLFAQN